MKEAIKTLWVFGEVAEAAERLEIVFLPTKLLHA